MTPAKKDSPPQEKTPTAEPKPQAGGGGGGGGVSADDWREQSEPHPAPPGTGPVPAKSRAAKAGVAPLAADAPPAGFTAGTPVTVTPYNAPGKASYFMVGTVLVGSEEAAAMALKNQLFLPSIPPVVAAGP